MGSVGATAPTYSMANFFKMTSARGSKDMPSLLDWEVASKLLCIILFAISLNYYWPIDLHEERYFDLRSGETTKRKWGSEIGN